MDLALDSRGMSLHYGSCQVPHRETTRWVRRAFTSQQSPVSFCLSAFAHHGNYRLSGSRESPGGCIALAGGSHSCLLKCGEDVGYCCFKGASPTASSHASFPSFFPHHSIFLTKSKAADQIFLSLARSALQKMAVTCIK